MSRQEGQTLEEKEDKSLENKEKLDLMVMLSNVRNGISGLHYSKFSAFSILRTEQARYIHILMIYTYTFVFILNQKSLNS